MKKVNAVKAFRSVAGVSAPAFVERLCGGFLRVSLPLCRRGLGPGLR